MFSSTTSNEDNITYTNNSSSNNISLNTVSSSTFSSKSPSSSSSSPSPYTPLNHHHHHHQKRMEEVWKDINLSSLQDNNTPSIIAPRIVPTNHSNIIFQDFLSTPFTESPQPPQPLPSRVVLHAAPPTVLSLHSGPIGNSQLQNHQAVSNVSFLIHPYEGFDSFNKKRTQDSDGGLGDRRHKRMIKNRESAARSRARKQAYTNELELEVAQLMEENARLRREKEELRLAAAAQLPKRHTLNRSSTAPF